MQDDPTEAMERDSVPAGESDAHGGRCSVVLMGSLSAASEAFDILRADPFFDLAAMVCRDDDPREAGERYAIDRAREHDVPVRTLETMPTADLGVAIRFDQILRARHLERFVLGVVNLHGAPLPEMRGSFCECAAILERRGEFGVSLHLMDDGVDTGPLLCVERFEIADDATAGELLREANRRGMGLVREHVKAYADGRLLPAPQDLAAGRTYRAAELAGLRDGPPPADPVERERHVRAFHYAPGPAVARSPVSARLRALLASLLPGKRA